MLSRELILDACGVINLVAGEAAGACLEKIDPVPHITSVVESVECRGKIETSEALDLLIRDGLLAQSDASISADDVLAFMAAHDIGAGESEAILACDQTTRHLWCDDRKARGVARERLGENSVTGTIGVLRELVRLRCLTLDEAFGYYTAMRAGGAFLPNMTIEDFSA